MVKNDKSFKKKSGEPHAVSAVQDKRFDVTKPQFRNIPQKDAKIELDDRFNSLLTDTRFQLHTTDKYGRKASKATKSKNNNELKEFYAPKCESTLSSIDEINNSTEKDITLKYDGPDSSSKGSESYKKGDNQKFSTDNPKARISYLTALSRGEVELSSSSDDDEDVVETDEESDYDTNSGIPKDTLGILDPLFKSTTEIASIVEFTSSSSPFVAVMNADWSHFRAVDIFAIVSSFVPPATLVSVKVYPSDFGMERLKKEELFGPVDVWRDASNGNNYPNNGTKQDENFDDQNENKYSSDSEASHTNPIDDINSDFDPEKLRLYESLRLKYFFAIVEFTHHRYADISYNEVDGMEFEHSSAALDLRVIPSDEVLGVIKGRKIRDEAFELPSNYSPPDFVVNALQQSTVECTWDMGDRNRETLLTNYNVSGQTWSQVSERDDLQAYLASDNSSDEERSIAKQKKSNKLRSLFGLDSDNDEDRELECKSETDDEDLNSSTKQTTYIPQEQNVSDEEIKKEKQELTPWEKFQEKRRQKKREKRAARRENRVQIKESRQTSSRSGQVDVVEEQEVFLESNASNDKHNTFLDQHVNKHQLPILGIYGDNKDKPDYDIRGLERLEKNSLKNLKGARKRKEEKFASSVTGTDFQIDMSDIRFQAALQGNDDRYGIDRTDPNFKETPAMHEILAEQTRNRAKKRKSTNHNYDECTTAIVPDTSGEANTSTVGSVALHALVTSIKSKVRSESV